MWRRSSLVLAVLGSTACAAATSSSTHPVAGAGRNVITAAEIVASHVTDVYQAVSQLRPEFLRRRALSTPVLSYSGVGVLVYVDDLRFGGAESLRYIPLDRVRLIRYIDPHEADLRWGGNHPSGAILVTTLR